jgi:DNA repair protein RecO (recombination protein O)
MARIEKTDAIVLRSIPFRETSIITTYLTRDFGKITTLAKGVRKQKALVLSHFEAFTYLTIQFYDNPRRDMHLLSDTVLKESFSKIRYNFDKICAASYMVDIVDKVTLNHQIHDDLFDITLFSLCELADASIQKIVRYFEIKILTCVGLFPNLSRCVLCGSKRIGNNVLFSFQNGGIVCSHHTCQAQALDAISISHGAVASINYIQTQSLDSFNRFQISKQCEDEIEEVMQKYITYHLSLELRTLRFMREVSNSRTGVNAL